MDSTITTQEYQDILTRLDEITNKLSANEKSPSIQWIDNQQLMFLLKISRRTAQNYRDNNIIAFSIIGNKIFYRMCDVEDLLNRHYHKRMV